MNNPDFFPRLKEFLNTHNNDVWFDIDGTLIEEKTGKLTVLGEYLINEGIEFKALTLGPWDISSLQRRGFNVSKVIQVLKGLQNGLIDYDDEGNLSKKVNALVDNEEHPLTQHLFKVEK